MATFLDNDAYAAFRSSQDISDMGDAAHAQIDALTGGSAPADQSDRAAQPSAPASQPVSEDDAAPSPDAAPADVAPTPVAASPAPAPTPDDSTFAGGNQASAPAPPLSPTRPVTAPLVAPVAPPAAPVTPTSPVTAPLVAPASTTAGSGKPSAIPDWLRTLIVNNAPDNLKNNEEFIATVAAGAKAESGWNPNSVQAGGGGRGLFQFDLGGMGAGLSDQQLFDPQFQAARIIPLYAAAYAKAPANLSGADKASWVAAQAERPLDYEDPNSTARRNYAAEYSTITGGAPYTGSQTAPGGTAASSTDASTFQGGAQASAPTAATGTPSWLDQLGTAAHQRISDLANGAGQAASAAVPTIEDMANAAHQKITDLLNGAAPTLASANAIASTLPQANMTSGIDPYGSIVQRGVPQIISGAQRGDLGMGGVLGGVLQTGSGVLSAIPGSGGAGGAAGDIASTAGSVADRLSPPAEAMASTTHGTDAILAQAQQAVDDLAKRYPQMSPGSLAASGPGKVLAAVQQAIKDAGPEVDAGPGAAPAAPNIEPAAAPASTVAPETPANPIGAGWDNASLQAEIDTARRAAGVPVSGEAAPLSRTAPAPADLSASVPAPAQAIPEYQRIAEESVARSHTGDASEWTPTQGNELDPNAAPTQTFDAQGNQVTGPGSGPQVTSELAPSDGAIQNFGDLKQPGQPGFDLGKTAWGALATAKQTLFSLSNFHVSSITQNMLFGPAGPEGAAQFVAAYAKGLVRPGSGAAATAGDLSEWFTRASDAGLLSNVGVNPETGAAARGALSPLAQRAAQSVGGGVLSGVGGYTAAKAGGASDQDALKAGLASAGIGAVLGPTVGARMNDALWTEAVPLAKVLTFKAAVQGGAPEAEAAMFAKNLLGGQGLQAIAGQAGLEIARLVFMSPDWLWSQANLIRDAGIGTAKSVPGVENIPGMGGPMTASQQLSRDFMLKAVATGTLVTQALQLALTGHFTNQNPPGKQFQVVAPNGTTLSMYAPNIQGELDLLSTRNPGQFIENRLGPLGTAGNVQANQQFPGSRQTIFPPGSGFPEQAKDVAGYVASRYAPIALTAPAQQANHGTNPALIALSLLSGLKLGHTNAPVTTTGGGGTPSLHPAPPARPPAHAPLPAGHAVAPPPARAPVKPAPARPLPLPARH